MTGSLIRSDTRRTTKNQVGVRLVAQARSSGTTATQFNYNTDRTLTRITRPDGQLIDVTYDTAGRRSTLVITRGSIGYSYSPITGRLTGITAPGGLGVDYSYDSVLLTGVNWSGAITGATAFTYNNDLRPRRSR